MTEVVISFRVQADEQDAKQIVLDAVQMGSMLATGSIYIRGTSLVRIASLNEAHP